MTLRELTWAADGRRKAEWDQTANLMALLANIHAGRRGRAFRPAQFHPYSLAQEKRLRARQRRENPAEGWAMFKAWFATGQASASGE